MGHQSPFQTHKNPRASETAEHAVSRENERTAIRLKFCYKKNKLFIKMLLNMDSWNCTVCSKGGGPHARGLERKCKIHSQPVGQEAWPGPLVWSGGVHSLPLTSASPPPQNGAESWVRAVVFEPSSWNCCQERSRIPAWNPLPPFPPTRALSFICLTAEGP